MVQQVSVRSRSPWGGAHHGDRNELMQTVGLSSGDDPPYRTSTSPVPRRTLVDSLLELAGMAGPLIAGLLTVPLTRAITNLVAFLDRAPAPVKQLIALVIAFGLTKLGGLLQLVLPESIELFTGSTTEALIAAAIAYGVHAGQKARAPTFRLLALILPALGFATPASTQILTDSVEVRIYEVGDLELVVSPNDFRGLVGDTVTFTAVALDGPTGDTIGAVITWSTDNPAAVSIDPDTGFARFLARGAFLIRVTAERVVSMTVYRKIGSSVFFLDTLHIDVGELAELCAYVIGSSGNIIAGSTGCPLPASSPGWAPSWPFSRFVDSKWAG